LTREWDRPDPEVLSIINRAGVLSFPHTYLDSSLLPLARTVNAIYRSGVKKVLALGVVHLSLHDISKEFSLDGLRHFMDLASRVHRKDPIPLEEHYVTRDREIGPDDLERIAEDMEAKGLEFRRSAVPDTAVVMTGDLSHWGHAYMPVVPSVEPYGQLPIRIRDALDQLFLRKDHMTYLRKSRELLNDQMYLGVFVSSFLGEPLDYRILSEELTDYSTVLGSERPTLVASMFYGVWRKASPPTVLER